MHLLVMNTIAKKIALIGISKLLQALPTLIHYPRVVIQHRCLIRNHTRSPSMLVHDFKGVPHLVVSRHPRSLPPQLPEQKILIEKCRMTQLPNRRIDPPLVGNPKLLITEIFQQLARPSVYNLQFLSNLFFGVHEIYSSISSSSIFCHAFCSVSGKNKEATSAQAVFNS